MLPKLACNALTVDSTAVKKKKRFCFHNFIKNCCLLYIESAHERLSSLKLRENSKLFSRFFGCFINVSKQILIHIYRENKIKISLK